MNTKSGSRGADKKRKAVTQADVAREAGVTRCMVSFALNSESGKSVAPETRKRILAAVERLHYHPNKYAQGIHYGNEGMAEKQIGVILNSAETFVRPYYAEMIAGIHSAAYQADYQVKYIRFLDDLRDPVKFNQFIHPEEIGSIILVATGGELKGEADQKLMDEIRARIRRVVCIEWRREGCSSIDFSRFDAAKMATAHLFERGYSDVAYIGELDERVDGFMSAAREHGVTDTSRLRVEGAFTMESGIDAIQKFEGNLPRAICAGSDEVAIGALRYLNERKILVPRQIAIASIDDIEMSKYTNPPLTTVNVRKRAMGMRAVDLIVKKLAEGEAQSVLLPVDLVPRAST